MAGIDPLISEKTRIRLIFAHPDPTQPNWPNIDYDFAGHIKEIHTRLLETCPRIEFSAVTVSSGSAEEGYKLLQDASKYDGYLIYLAGCLWGDMTETVMAAGKPTVIVDHLFAGSGEFLTSFARAKRAGHKVIAVSSSRFEDMVDALKCIDCVKKLRLSTLLVVGRGVEEPIKRTYGTTVKEIQFDTINEKYNKIKPAEAKTVATRWINEAEKVIEPSQEDIEKAAAMYLAMRNLLQENNAQAITINCLGGIYSGRMVEAYPCLGFMQLDNDGLVGGCEADQKSAMTKLLMHYLAGRPGLISDPVIDTSKNQIIYAHCVASTKVFGPDGPSNPYHLRDHSEDHKGACCRSLMPLGEMTTTLLFDHNKKQVILHQGKTVENVDEYRACRTKLAVEVQGDVYKLLNYWDEWGWHRVTFFGDLKRPVYNIAALLGFEVVEEA
jgi:L-fucose isomerase-like protein